MTYIINKTYIELMKTNTKLSTVAGDTGFPQLAVLPAIQAIRQIAQQLGSSTYKRESLVVALGYTGISGAASKKVAALVHYGLLMREGHTYCLTELGRRSATTESEQAKIELFKEVFNKSYLFKTLFERFEGLPLPGALERMLVAEYALSPRVAEGMTEAFKESLIVAEYIEDGVIGGHTHQLPTVQPFKEGSGQRISLPSGIYLEIPQNLTYALALGRFKEAIEALEAAASR